MVANPDTWLGFTDLVFVDPVGTGFSRAEGEEKDFWGVSQDLEALAVFVRKWTQANGRALSPKYLVGESYGGFRAARLPQMLATEHGVGIAGIVLVSPAIEFGLMHSDWLLPLADALRLPAYAATALERSDPARASRLYRQVESGSDSWAQNALYARGRLEASRGNTGEARRLLEQYLARFPRGSNAEDARAVLRRLR